MEFENSEFETSEFETSEFENLEFEKSEFENLDFENSEFDGSKFMIWNSKWKNKIEFQGLLWNFLRNFEAKSENPHCYKKT